MKISLLRIFIIVQMLLIASCSGGGGGGTSGGAATLQWTAPTSDIDGTPITVKKYKIYYGTEPGTYTLFTPDIDANLTTYTVTGLATGATYYFVVTAFDASDVESDPTDEQAKTL